MKETALYKKLQELEAKEFGEKSFPLSNNISNNLIPVAEILLNRIPSYMSEYTLHDIKHCKAILDNINNIIPSDVHLNIVELTILFQAVILHDIGMVINKTKAIQIKETEGFKNILLEYDKGADEEEILTEYIRRTHVQRSLEYIDIFKKDFSTYKIDFEFKGIDISDWVKNVIESHSFPIERLYDLDKYPTEKLIEHHTVNIQYLSILLRLGDILDFDIYRTPYFLFVHINPENKISRQEWAKHLSIEGKRFTENEIRFDAKCTNSKIERGVREFVNWIEIERRESIALLEAKGNSKYKLNLKNNVLINVRNDGSYIYTDLKLDLDYKKVLNILMGTELYDTPDIFIRELLQNAYDACKYRQELCIIDGEAYDAKIQIKYDTTTNILEIEDNGIGIDTSTFEKYVLKIGNSFYKSKSFEKEHLKFTPISNFGIGILSCFMVSETINIQSLKYKKGLESCIPINYTLFLEDRYIDEKKGTKGSFGTRITLKLHEAYNLKLKTKNIIDIINENTAHQIIPISIKIDEVETILNKTSIDVPEEYKAINDILVIELSSVSWLEGFIVIHQGQHQQIIAQNKISQQGFTITSKSNSNINLNIGWLQFCRFFINILPENKLNLRASRNSVKEDEKLVNLRNTIIETIVDYFQKPENKAYLPMFLNSARGNVLSGNQKEYDFLKTEISFNLINCNTLNTIKFNFENILNHSINKEISFAIISPQLLATNKSNQAFISEIKSYKYVIINDGLIHYFIQFSKPITIINEIVVSKIPGLVYNKLVIKPTRVLEVKDYNLEYSWHRSYDINNQGSYESLFCVIANNHYNSIDIQINEKHNLGALLKRTENLTYTKRFKGSLKTNLALASINHTKLSNYIAHNGESHFMVNNYYAYSLNNIGFMQTTFLDELNKSLKNDLLVPLSNLGHIAKTEVDNYLLTVNDFPAWWAQK
ncbi:MAG: HD domain-containing protein [Bacteroidota bacterium]